MERIKDFLIGAMATIFLIGTFVVAVYGPTTTWPNDRAYSPPACTQAATPCLATPIVASEPE